jgi:hypothetical protein
MQHRISLSKDLLIVLAANKRRRRYQQPTVVFVPKVSGIKIDSKPADVKRKFTRFADMDVFASEGLFASIY